MECRVFNLNLDLARQIGFGGYERVAMFKGVEAQVGEWLFAREAWEENFGPTEEEFVESCQRELKTIPKVQDKKGWLLKIRRDVVPAYLLQCLRRLEKAGDLDVVAFSCSFFQTLSSLALGRLIKKEYPHVKVVYGGACFHDEMGRELMEKIPWIDAVSTGEADDVIVPLFRKLLDGSPPSNLQGIIYRHNGNLHYGPASQPVSAQVLEDLPDPDYSDFFADSRNIGISNDPSWRMRVRLFFESSRGCWWGQKHHCSFCGLNGRDLTYRVKSAERVYQTLTNFANLYPSLLHQASDNNMSMQYFETLLPKLEREPLKNGIKIFYEVKTNLNRPQIKALADAGIVYLQPGIESLSNHILQLMHKGTTTIQNLSFLKCCRDYGIFVFWNNLIRLPGELEEDYLGMEELIPKIHHLYPPSGGAKKVECHRFSPYFTGRAKGAENPQPLSWYSALYPEEKIDQSRVAYYFNADWMNTLGDGAYEGVISRTREWLDIWQREMFLPELRYQLQADGGATVLDTRQGHTKEIKFDIPEAGVLQAIQEPANIDTISRLLEDKAISRDTIEDTLQSFVESNLAFEESGRYLGLALEHDAKDLSHSVRCGFLPLEY